MANVLRYAAFTEDPAGGNPAGVVLDARGLGEAEMLAIAAQVGYSETAFLEPAGDRRYAVRYFSPLAEVAFCGHATIASAVALAERMGPGPLSFDTPAGSIPLDTARGPLGLVATLTSAPTHARPASREERDDALAALRWPAADLDPQLPGHVAFAGVEHLVLGAATRARLRELDYDFAGLAEVMTRHGWTTVSLVWREAALTFHARNPFPVGGIVEDPATGAAAAAVGGLVRDLGLVEVPSTFTIHQGEDMGRPSTLLVGVRGDDRRVRVTGGAIPITEPR